MHRRLLFASPALLLGGGASAQSWTDRPLRLVVPFGGGGPADAVARIAMEGASQALGQRITIENRPGAGAVVGSEAVFRAPADGSTFLLATVSHVVSAGIVARLPYDPEKDFQGVALTGTVPLVVVVHPDNPARTFPELLARMREPGEHDYGTSGVGSAQHLGGALLGAMAGLRLNQVPYRGNPSALTDLAGGRLTFVMESTATTVPLVRAGTLRALAVTGPTRSALLPDVPTVAEAGVPGFEAYTWNAILARAGTPEAAIRGMNAAVNAGLKSQVTADRLRNAGIEITDSMTPGMVDEFVASQGAKWRPLLASAGVRPE